jgi:hypothetical protein
MASSLYELLELNTDDKQHVQCRLLVNKFLFLGTLLYRTGRVPRSDRPFPVALSPSIAINRILPPSVLALPRSY